MVSKASLWPRKAPKTSRRFPAPLDGRADTGRLQGGSDATGQAFAHIYAR